MEAVKRSQEGAERARIRYIKLQVCSRVTAALAAATLMGFNKQTSVVAGFAIEASYRSSPAFKSAKLGADRFAFLDGFFVVGNAIACGYSVVSLPFISNLVDNCTFIISIVNFFLIWLVMAATSTIGYVGMHGNDEIGWAKVCPYYERFCRRTEIALGYSYVAFLLFLFVLSVFSSRSTSLGKFAV
ncbi:unnamed protein product, partial [Musa textilis]